MNQDYNNLNNNFNQNSNKNLDNSVLNNNQNIYSQSQNNLNDEYSDIKQQNYLDQNIQQHDSIKQDLNGINSNKSSKNKTIVIIIVIAIVLLLIIVGTIILTNKSKSENIPGESINKNNNISSVYRIILNNKEVNLPTKLNTLIDNGFIYVGDLDFNSIEQDGDYLFGLNNNSINYYGVPKSDFNYYGTIIDFNLRFNDNSRKYSDVAVRGITATNVSNDFFSINGIGCGNTLEEVIAALKIDKNSENYLESSSKDYIEYKDLKNNFLITIAVDDGKVFNISIVALN